MLLLIYVILASVCIYRFVIKKLEEFNDEIRKIKDEQYFHMNKCDGITELKDDMSDLTNKFYMLQNFYNKRMNIVYKDIYVLKNHMGDVQLPSFDIEG